MKKKQQKEKNQKSNTKIKKKQHKKGQRYETGDTMKRANKTRKLKKKTANKNIAGAHTVKGGGERQKYQQGNKPPLTKHMGTKKKTTNEETKYH